jgi:glucose uptake protein GlcU
MNIPVIMGILIIIGVLGALMPALLAGQSGLVAATAGHPVESTLAGFIVVAVIIAFIMYIFSYANPHQPQYPPQYPQ